jgi:hypothetical protein
MAVGDGEVVNTLLQESILRAKELRLVWSGHTPYLREDGRWVLPFPRAGELERTLPKGGLLTRVQSLGENWKERWDGRWNLWPFCTLHAADPLIVTGPFPEGWEDTYARRMFGALVLLLDYSHGGGKISAEGRPSYPKDRNDYKVRWCWEFLYDFYPWFLHRRISRPPYLEEWAEDLGPEKVRPWNLRQVPLSGEAVCSHNGKRWTPREHPDLSLCAAEIRKVFGRMEKKARGGDRDAAVSARRLRPFLTGYQHDVLLAEFRGEPPPEEAGAYTLLEAGTEDDDEIEEVERASVVDLSSSEEGETSVGSDAIREVVRETGGRGPA